MSDTIQLNSGSGGIVSLLCREFASDIFTSSRDYGISDPLLLLALMQQESNCVGDAISIDNSSIGLMQVNKNNCGAYGLPSDKEECKDLLIADTSLNIKVGARIFKDKYTQGSIHYECEAFNSSKQNESAVNKTYTGWEAAVRRYNGGACAGYRRDGREIFADQNYVEEVMDKYKDIISRSASSSSSHSV